MEAERDIVDLKKCQFVADKVGEIYRGMVTSVHAFGFFVELDEIYVEGLVHVSTLEDDFYQYEEERYRRITSYNVCYTKLLRTERPWTRACAPAGSWPWRLRTAIASV